MSWLEAGDALVAPVAVNALQDAQGCLTEKLHLACTASALKSHLGCFIPTSNLRTLGLLVVVTQVLP